MNRGVKKNAPINVKVLTLERLLSSCQPLYVENQLYTEITEKGNCEAHILPAVSFFIITVIMLITSFSVVMLS